MYHVELRQFPHTACSFNLSEQELRTVLEPWVREQAVDFGERKWSPHTAKLTVLEGPQIPVQQLSMGRGWRTAQHEGEDVTMRVLLAAGEAADAARGPAPPGPAPAQPGAAAAQPGVVDPLAAGAELSLLLGGDPARLLAAWREVAARASGLAPSEALALAERKLGESGAGGE